jgi:exopolyphosphatase/guanosine-5'-triphosphate,3'-diphosphate pyrophosphatase
MPSSTHGNYQALTAEEKRTVQLLAPVLRLADGLDRRHDQRVAGVQCRVEDDRVTLRLTGDGDIDLEQWAATRAGDTFREVYGIPLAVERSRA